MPHRQGRRDFLKTSVVAGLSVWIASPGHEAVAALFEAEYQTPVPWNPKTGQIRYRTDGTAKVTGEKIFSIDMLARDLPGWPKTEAHAMLLRVTRADRRYAGFDLSSLPAGLQPTRVVTAADLERDGVRFPAFYGDDMLLPEGKTPAYLGQAVALLIWADFIPFRLAKARLKFNDALIRWGDETGPVERPPWAAWRFVRVGGDTPYAEDRFSSLKDAPLFPAGFRKRLPVWPDPNVNGNLDAQGMAWADQLARMLDTPSADTLVLERQYFSQSIDTAAMELDNGLGWFDRERGTVHFVTATQSPQEIADAGAPMLAATTFGIGRFILHPCDTVGYGSKDHSPYPFYALAASLYGDGRPVRLANDRYEQFQSSLKRHAFRMKYRIAVDRTSGKIQVFAADMVGNGGGRQNFSPSVCLVAATAAQSIYYLPRSDIASTVLATRALDAGSARGYGTLQSMGATEMLIDEVAEALGMDPIELRLRNVMLTGMKNTQGAIPGGALRNDEILELARRHPLWLDREARKRDYEAANPGQRYGVGFGCVQKDFGTGAEAAFVEITLDPSGRLGLRHSITEIGTGAATSQAALCVRWLGRPADETLTAETDWAVLPMRATDDPWTMSQAVQDAHETDPTWTPNYCSPSSASNSAYFGGQGTSEATRVLFLEGLWPAALAIWGRGIGGGQLSPYVTRPEDARWEDGRLNASGMAPLSIEQLAQTAHDLGLVTGVVVHTFNRWQWAEAEFPLPGGKRRLAIDGLALRFGGGGGGGAEGVARAEGSAGADGTEGADGTDRVGGAAAPAVAARGFRPIARERVWYPPTQRNNAGVVYYATMATLAAVVVETATGKTRLLDHHSWLDCGRQIVPQLVSGQIQGGLAMGIGHALHEYLPLYEDGPGDGTWNFNRYTVPRASDVAVWTQGSTVLPPLSATDPPKGMAEVVMIAVVPAIINGIHHAAGIRIRELPASPARVLAALNAIRLPEEIVA